MLRSYRADSRAYDFVQWDWPKYGDENTFTVIVGRNGTGKSRLLRAVVTHLIEDRIDRNALVRDERINLVRDPRSSLEFDTPPSHVICVSTSPFDKFPLLRRDRVAPGYIYLGLRGLPSQNLGLAYMARTVFALIDAAATSPTQARAVASVLEYLDYEGVIHVALHLPPTSFLEELLASEDPGGVLEEYLGRPMLYPGEGLGPLRQLQAMEPEKFSEVIDAARRVVPLLTRGRSDVSRGRVDVFVNANGVHIEARWPGDSSDLLLLARSGLLRLREVVLSKRGVDRPLKLHEASSGEQAVVMGLLGIGSQIRDGALVCIDEPEVCLHPEWQEKYIELLFNTFRQYRGCHFIIATHSPQIVAQLPSGNCYVMSMEDGSARNASEFAQRSIDFQLAEVFHAPGYRNEYLGRLALNCFARVSKTKKFDKDALQALDSLRRVFATLRADDPLRELIAALEQMLKTYG